MTWQDELTPAEKRLLDKAKGKRDAASADYKAIRTKLKARCDSRIRTKKGLNRKGGA